MVGKEEGSLCVSYVCDKERTEVPGQSTIHGAQLGASRGHVEVGLVVVVVVVVSPLYMLSVSAVGEVEVEAPIPMQTSNQGGRRSRKRAKRGPFASRLYPR